jgi:hypothetical protein
MDPEKNDHSYWLLQGVSLFFVLLMLIAIFIALKKHVDTCYAIPGAILLSLFPASMFFKEEIEEIRSWWVNKHTKEQQ